MASKYGNYTVKLFQIFVLNFYVSFSPEAQMILSFVYRMGVVPKWTPHFHSCMRYIVLRIYVEQF